MRKLLVANRSEIACRVMRTAHRLGYRTVAVYSDADANAPHVRQADEAVHIGASPAVQSYLRIDAVLDAARTSGADAVHPGYGFLSENADFAQVVLDAGLVFIGAPPAAMRAMGHKATAKRRMIEAGVPCAGGYLGDDQSDQRFATEAARLGFPLLVKAVSGGGGRGMRLVRAEPELAAAIVAARREAESAFGDSALMLEQLIADARHVEVQVFADTHGNVVHLGERDCSAQRRRQKVVEESPSPVVTPALREAMGRDAVAAARAVGYVGAGTVEFIVDADLRHYFLEMNTRLQVEHPVTEAVTGLDLVEWQLRVAAGEPLPLAQHEIRFEGHAIEARLYAEDPAHGFAPQTGRVAHWRPTTQVRIDTGIEEGSAVTPFYDPLLAKLIAHGGNRADAIRRLVRALEDTPLVGVRNNGRFLRDLLRHPDFAEGRMTTEMIDGWTIEPPQPDEEAWLVAAAARALHDRAALRPASVTSFDITLVCQGQSRTLRDLARVRVLERGDPLIRYTVDGVTKTAVLVDNGRELQLVHDGAVFGFHEPSPWPAEADAADAARARAPVAGVVAQVLVAPGDAVAAGQPLASVEAMKMEMWLNARAAGTVRAVHAKPKDPIEAGALLVELDLEA
jgi:geranyl-CoA carboxylase alpha subunit